MMLCPLMSWRKETQTTIECAKEECAWWTGKECATKALITLIVDASK